MTVHGAKGLEAPIVILPDTAARQDGANAPGVLRLRTGRRPGACATTRRRRRWPTPRRAGARWCAPRTAAALRGADARQDLADRLRRRRAGPATGARAGTGWWPRRSRRLAPAVEPGPDGALVLEHRWTRGIGGGRRLPRRRRRRRCRTGHCAPAGRPAAAPPPLVASGSAGRMCWRRAGRPGRTRRRRWRAAAALHRLLEDAARPAAGGLARARGAAAAGRGGARGAAGRGWPAC